MKVWNRIRRGEAPAGPEGVQVKMRSSQRPAARPADIGRSMPSTLMLGVVLATVFYVLAHISIINGVWPVHGTSAGAGAMLMRNAVALFTWLLVLLLLRWLGYRGNWAVVALPVIIFCIARPAQFQVFTDPVYQAARGARAEANTLKAQRSRLSTIERAYEEERKAVVFAGEVPPLPDPFAEVAAQADRGALLRSAAHLPIFVAPIALLLGFLWAREPRELRRLRERKRWPFFLTLAVFFVLTLFFTELGKVRGTTPWELFLPIFVLTWAATLAEDAYNLARPGAVMAPRRILGLLIYGALPVVPFLVIRELGLSVVLAGTLAVMLLVGTRRGWWAALMLGVWAVLVIAAFNLDLRSATRLQLAYAPYKDLSQVENPERWAASVHQIKLFDANVLEGGIIGAGPGRGHAETAPNAADDGYITMIAAQYGWLGSLALVLLYTVFLVQMISVGIRERGAFERTVAVGLALLIAIPFWLATLGGLRVIPLTGVAATFAGHGGAKLLASALAVGIIAGISHRRAVEERLTAAAGVPAAAQPAEGVRIV
ncbi:hypothetical protein BH24GEM3_BH24GEM3_27980 [soil metagenome]